MVAAEGAPPPTSLMAACQGSALVPVAAPTDTCRQGAGEGCSNWGGWRARAAHGESPEMAKAHTGAAAAGPAAPALAGAAATIPAAAPARQTAAQI